MEANEIVAQLRQVADWIENGVASAKDWKMTFDREVIEDQELQVGSQRRTAVSGRGILELTLKAEVLPRRG